MKFEEKLFLGHRKTINEGETFSKYRIQTIVFQETFILEINLTHNCCILDLNKDKEN